jgi:hypothetical protein
MSCSFSIKSLVNAAVLTAITLLYFAGSYAHAMQIYNGQFHGRDVLFLTGSITDGDAAKYQRIIFSVPVQPDGSKLVILNSPGGLVDEAFKIAELNEGLNVHMHIPKGAICVPTADNGNRRMLRVVR